MTYSEDFKKRVIDALGDRIKPALDSGSDIVGRYLYDNSCLNLTNIDDDFEAGNFEVVHDKIRRALKIRNLYEEYLEISKEFQEAEETNMFG